MDSLPVELITKIAFLACTDGGRTGSALSAVSRRVRDTSHPARYFTVSLASCPERFDAFINTYEAQRSRIPHTTPRVSHLFLSLLPIEGEPMYRVPPLPFEQMFHAYDKYLASLHTLGETYGPTLGRIIRALAPDLETLAFVRGEWKGVGAVHCAFPRLRELTLVDACPEFLRIEDAPPSQAPLFPALTRLHTVEHFYARPLDFRLWAPHAPRLTHLRCSGIHHHNSPTAISLQEISAYTPPQTKDGCEGHEDERRDVPFPHLQHVLVQPVSRKCNPAYPWDGQRTLCDDLQVCAARARRGLRLDVLPPCTPLLETLAAERAAPPGKGGATEQRAVAVETAPQRCIKRAQEVWLERVEGRAGCWSAEYAF